MAAGWVAGSVRAKALARRRMGRAAARALAGRPSLGEALTGLTAGPYGHDVRPDQTLAEAEHAVGAAVLWNIRVLAGWLPAAGADVLRVLAGWFEIANTDELVRSLSGKPAAPPYRLGTLATAWPRLALAGSLGEVRTVLATSVWGDPGGESPRQIGLGMRLAWAGRVAQAAPAAAAWAAGGAALLVARERFAEHRTLADPWVAGIGGLLGADWPAATSVDDLAGRLPGSAAWAVHGLAGPTELWRGEARWWARLHQDSAALLRSARFGPDPVLGATALLAADGWRVCAALELAARGGGPQEAFDVLA
jgi:hypothetical protein